eukprot:1145629-Pelagomonas_calceolata.AAC.3
MGVEAVDAGKLASGGAKAARTTLRRGPAQPCIRQKQRCAKCHWKAPGCAKVARATLCKGGTVYMAGAHDRFDWLIVA